MMLHLIRTILNLLPERPSLSQFQICRQLALFNDTGGFFAKPHPAQTYVRMLLDAEDYILVEELVRLF